MAASTERRGHPGRLASHEPAPEPDLRMRLLKLEVADLPLDDRDAPTRTVWINPSQIETMVEYVTWDELDPILWLELTLASGTVHYSRVGPVAATALEGVTERAIEELLPT